MVNGITPGSTTASWCAVLHFKLMRAFEVGQQSYIDLDLVRNSATASQSDVFLQAFNVSMQSKLASGNDSGSAQSNQASAGAVTPIADYRLELSAPKRLPRQHGSYVQFIVKKRRDDSTFVRVRECVITVYQNISFIVNGTETCYSECWTLNTSKSVIDEFHMPTHLFEKVPNFRYQSFAECWLELGSPDPSYKPGSLLGDGTDPKSPWGRAKGRWDLREVPAGTTPIRRETILLWTNGAMHEPVEIRKTGPSSNCHLFEDCQRKRIAYEGTCSDHARRKRQKLREHKARAAFEHAVGYKLNDISNVIDHKRVHFKENPTIELMHVDARRLSRTVKSKSVRTKHTGLDYISLMQAFNAGAATHSADTGLISASQLQAQSIPLSEFLQLDECLAPGSNVASAAHIHSQRDTHLCKEMIESVYGNLGKMRMMLDSGCTPRSIVPSSFNIDLDSARESDTQFLAAFGSDRTSADKIGTKCDLLFHTPRAAAAANRRRRRAHTAPSSLCGKCPLREVALTVADVADVACC
eukprot:COSAG01_NODE_5334_length_4326_cov_144.633073_4_plen_526_part_00